MKRLFVMSVWVLVFGFHLAAQMGVNSPGQHMQCGAAVANWMTCTISQNVITTGIAGARNAVPWNWTANNQGEFSNLWIDGSGSTPFPVSGFVQAPKVRYDNGVFTMYVPANAHAGYGNGVAGAFYTLNNSTALGGIGVYGQCIVGANAIYCASANFQSSDSNCKDYHSDTCTSYAVTSLWDQENDLGVTNANTASAAGLMLNRPWSTQNAQGYDVGAGAWRSSFPYQSALGSETFSCTSGCTSQDVMGELILPGSWSGGPVMTIAGALDTRIKFSIKDDGTGTGYYFNVDPWDGTYGTGLRVHEHHPYSTSSTCMITPGYTTMCFTFGHNSGYSATDMWAWPGTGNTPWLWGFASFDGSASKAAFMAGAQDVAGTLDPSQPVLFHGYGSTANSVYATLQYFPANHNSLAATSSSVDVQNTALLANQTLANPTNLGAAAWSYGNDCAASGSNAVCAYATGSGTIYEAKAQLAIPGAGNRWYQFTYTISNVTGYPTASITTGFGSLNEPLIIANGTYTTYFVSAAAPTNFVISATLYAAGQTFTLSNLSLKQITGGDVNAGGVVSGQVFVSNGSTPTASGAGGTCATGPTVAGGQSAGTITIPAGDTACTSVTLTFAISAPTGWACFATDRTHTGDGAPETNTTQTTAVFTVSPSANDVIQYACTAY